MQCPEVSRVLLPAAAPVPHFLLPVQLPGHSAHAPTLSTGAAVPLCLPGKQPGSGESRAALPGASRVSLPWWVPHSAAAGDGGAVPDPHPPHGTFTGTCPGFCPGSITARGWTGGNSHSVMFRISFEPLCPTVKFCHLGPIWVQSVRSRCVSCRVRTSPGMEVAQGQHWVCA